VPTEAQQSRAPSGRRRSTDRECRAAKDPGILIRYWLGIDRQKQLLGSEGSGLDVNSMIKKARAICAPSAYEANAPVPSAPSGISVAGLICSSGEPFSLKMDGDFIGRMRFTPSSDQAGSLTHVDGTIHIPVVRDTHGGGPAKIN
jgi:hypothetical protein